VWVGGSGRRRGEVVDGEGTGRDGGLDGKSFEGRIKEVGVDKEIIMVCCGV